MALVKCAKHHLDFEAGVAVRIIEYEINAPVSRLAFLAADDMKVPKVEKRGIFGDPVLKPLRLRTK